MTRKPLFVLSGCSGGGKSTLLAELARRGHSTFQEPGRRVVQEERASGGNALPDTDPAAFARRCINLAAEDFHAAPDDHVSFCDRSVIDAVSFLDHAGLTTPDLSDIVAQCHYAKNVFLTPPWPEIFETDAERTHSFDTAVAEYDRLKLSFPTYGYTAIDIPHAPVTERADFVLRRIAEL